MINRNEYNINIAIFEQLEQVFADEGMGFDQQKFKDNKTKFFTTLKNYGYKNDKKKIKKITELFKGFEAFDRYQHIQSALKLNSASTLNPYAFFLALFNENTKKKPIDVQTLDQIRQLISLQKEAYIRNYQTDQTPITENALTSDQIMQTISSQHNACTRNHLTDHTPKTRFQTCAPYIKPSFMMVAGSGLALFGGMLQFNAQFALLMGLQLHPALLAALVIGGMMMAGVGIYRAMGTYQANNPTPDIESTRVSSGICVSLLNRFGSFGSTPTREEQSTSPNNQKCTELTHTYPTTMER